jgi:LPXTG-site transpeptidase (sortase) family protein
MLGCFLSSRVARELVQNQIARRPSYLVIPNTPVFELPTATPTPVPTSTPLPTHTPTPTPTPTPLPMPAIRLSIPAIALSVPIEEVHPVLRTTWYGGQKLVWQVPAFRVGHYDSSGYPAEGTNIVLVGHNNTAGAVFRHLSQVDVGDEVILFTADDEFHYKVQKNTILRFPGAESEAEAQLRFYTTPKSAERVTLISCWPYATNAHRIVIVAFPSLGGSRVD